MAITVIDQGPELFWFVSSALVNDEQLRLRHIKDVTIGENAIFHDLPQIVIVNGDDKSIDPPQFVNKMRNHVFARNTLFIVFTADLSVEYKKELLVAGAGQVFYKGKGFAPSPVFFASLIKWFLNYKNPDPQVFEYKPVQFPAEVEMTTFGRIGWISATHMLLECNLDLNPGQSFQFKNSLFEELEIKNTTFVVEQKNSVGRYYQYANSLLCKIITKDADKDRKKIENWIENNFDISKDKPVKICYFEPDPEYRAKIKEMIKFDKRYCARGYGAFDNLAELLEYQKPHLVLVNRAMVLSDKVKFDPMKVFLRNNFCYCVTYADPNALNAEAPPAPLAEFEKEYNFAIHSPGFVDLPLLESMVEKLHKKLSKKYRQIKKVFSEINSRYSRINLFAHVHLKEIAITGASFTAPFTINNFCALELRGEIFENARLDVHQFLELFQLRPQKEAIYSIDVFSWARMSKTIN